jgi:hypothetical protein
MKRFRKTLIRLSIAFGAVLVLLLIVYGWLTLRPTGLSAAASRADRIASAQTAKNRELRQSVLSKPYAPPDESDGQRPLVIDSGARQGNRKFDFIEFTDRQLVGRNGKVFPRWVLEPLLDAGPVWPRLLAASTAQCRNGLLVVWFPIPYGDDSLASSSVSPGGAFAYRMEQRVFSLLMQSSHTRNAASPGSDPDSPSPQLAELFALARELPEWTQWLDRFEDEILAEPWTEDCGLPEAQRLQRLVCISILRAAATGGDPQRAEKMLLALLPAMPDLLTASNNPAHFRSTLSNFLAMILLAVEHGLVGDDVLATIDRMLAGCRVTPEDLQPIRFREAQQKIAAYRARALREDRRNADRSPVDNRNTAWTGSSLRFPDADNAWAYFMNGAPRDAVRRALQPALDRNLDHFAAVWAEGDPGKIADVMVSHRRLLDAMNYQQGGVLFSLLGVPRSRNGYPADRKMWIETVAPKCSPTVAGQINHDLQAVRFLIAAERYRLRESRWPATLADLTGLLEPALLTGDTGEWRMRIVGLDATYPPGAENPLADRLPRPVFTWGVPDPPAGSASGDAADPPYVLDNAACYLSDPPAPSEWLLSVSAHAAATPATVSATTTATTPLSAPTP